MPTVTFIQANAYNNAFNPSRGASLMQGTTDNMLEGIVVERGGSFSCTTCYN